MAHSKNTVILTHGDVDGVCAATIVNLSYPKAKVEFTIPSEFVSKLDSLSGYDRVIILDLGIDNIQKDEAIAAFRKLSTNSSIIYIDHHLRPPGLTQSSLVCKGAYRTDASTSELAWEFFKPPASHDFIAVLGAIGDYKERTPQMQGLIAKYDERRVYPEALFLEWALMVSEDSFKLGVIEEFAQGKWPYQMSIMDNEADAILRRQRTLERYVRENAEKICEHVMLVRDPPFKATGPAATLLTKLDKVDIGIASRIDGNHVYLSMRRHEESNKNLASLIDQSASKFGSMGGGHVAAAGGKIPVERFDEFLLEIRRRLSEGQLKRIKKLDVKSAGKKTIERKLFKETIERKRAERAMEERARDLAERDKELSCLYNISDLIGKPNISLEEIIRWTVDIICRAWRYPNITCARIILGDKEYKTKNFKETVWKQASDIVVQGELIGALEVYYLEERPESDEGSFTKEERTLINAIAGQLGKFARKIKVENALKNSEEKYKILVAELPQKIFLKDRKSVYVSCNVNYAKDLKLKPADIAGKTDYDLYPKKLAEKYRSDDKEVTKYGKTIDTDEEYIQDGKKIFVHTVKTPVKDTKGNIVGILGVFSDITDRKKAESRMKSERELYRLIANATNQSRSVEECCELALKGIQTATNCNMLDVVVYRESENALLSVAQVGYPEDLYQRTIKRQDLKDESRVAVQAIRERKSIYVDDMKTSKLTSYSHDLVTKYDISTLYVVPLLCSGKLQGVLEVLTTGDRKLSKEDREVLDTISEELAGGIAKAKIEEQLVTVKEAFGWIAVPTKDTPPLYPHL